jgi:hypothetical protein
MPAMLTRPAAFGATKAFFGCTDEELAVAVPPVVVGESFCVALGTMGEPEDLLELNFGAPSVVAGFHESGSFVTVTATLQKGRWIVERTGRERMR